MSAVAVCASVTGVSKGQNAVSSHRKSVNVCGSRPSPSRFRQPVGLHGASVDQRLSRARAAQRRQQRSAREHRAARGQEAVVGVSARSQALAGSSLADLHDRPWRGGPARQCRRRAGLFGEAVSVARGARARRLRLDFKPCLVFRSTTCVGSRPSSDLATPASPRNSRAVRRLRDERFPASTFRVGPKAPPRAAPRGRRSIQVRGSVFGSATGSIRAPVHARGRKERNVEPV